MNANEVIINQKEHTDIYNWLSENVYNYKIHKKELYTLTSDVKINTYCDVHLYTTITQIEYPFGCVNGFFSCNGCTDLTSLIGAPEKVRESFHCDGCSNLTSLIGSPEKVGGYFSCDSCKNLTSLKGLPKHIKGDISFANNKFSNNPKYKERYKLYLAMWLELLESVNNEERKEYITNYKDKKNYYGDKPIIPVEILKEYGF